LSNEQTTGEIVIRPYEADDRAGVRNVCYETGFMGEPVDWLWRDRESFSDMFSGYWTDREPGSASVADLDGEIVGYLLGCADSRRVWNAGKLLAHHAFRRGCIVRPGTDRVVIEPRARGQVVELLAVGSVVPRKGYDILVTALAKITDLAWRLIIAGDRERSAQTVQRLDAEIVRLGLAGRITFAGAVAPQRLMQLYAAADLFVLPSRFEGYGMAYAEAIAHGVPVVGTQAGAIPDTVPAAAGVLVPPEDVDALAAVLRRLTESPSERERLAAGARAAAATFPTWPESARLFARVLEQVAEQSAGQVE